MRLFPIRLNPLDPRRAELSITAIERYLHYMAERGDVFSTDVNKRFDELTERIQELEKRGGGE